jgi:hypothetical protein
LDLNNFYYTLATLRKDLRKHIQERYPATWIDGKLPDMELRHCEIVTIEHINYEVKIWRKYHDGEWCYYLEII